MWAVAGERATESKRGKHLETVSQLDSHSVAVPVQPKKPSCHPGLAGRIDLGIDYFLSTEGLRMVSVNSDNVLCCVEEERSPRDQVFNHGFLLTEGMWKSFKRKWEKEQVHLSSLISESNRESKMEAP